MRSTPIKKTENQRIHFHYSINSKKGKQPAAQAKSDNNGYCADIYFNWGDYSDISLTIENPPNDLERKIPDAISNNQGIGVLFSKLEVTPGHSLKNLNLSESKIKDFKSIKEFWGNKIELGLSRVKYYREHTEEYDESFVQINLNKEALKLFRIQRVIKTSGKVEFNYKPIEFKFSGYNIKIGVGFLSADTEKTRTQVDNQTLIVYRPVITISPSRRNIHDVNFKKMVNLGSLICHLMSLYLGREIIPVRIQEIKPTGSNVSINTYIDRYELKSEEFFIKTKLNDFFKASDLIHSELLDNYNWWEENIFKYVQSRMVDKSSKFLLLYNILENCFIYLKKIRRVIPSEPKVYFGNLDPKKEPIKGLCQRLIDQISELIENPIEKEAFLESNLNLGFKNSILLKKSAQSRRNIELVIESLQMDYTKHNIPIDIKCLIEIRDGIIHGNITEFGSDLKKINKGFSSLAKECLLKLIWEEMEVKSKII